MDYVLKKIGLVAAATVGLSLAAAPAFAAPGLPDNSAPHNPNMARVIEPLFVTDPITYADAWNGFVEGGGALGYGAAALVAGAYTGIGLTPSLIKDSLTCGSGC